MLNSLGPLLPFTFCSGEGEGEGREKGRARQKGGGRRVNHGKETVGVTTTVLLLVTVRGARTCGE
jgi:hypothetical protein